MAKTSGIRMARNTRLGILRRAREILSDESHWTKGVLRKKQIGGETQYCVAGALEQAAYDLGYAEQQASSFDDGDWLGQGPLGFLLSGEVSLNTYSSQTYGALPWSINDRNGYEKAVELLDGYIVEVEEGRALEPEVAE